MSISQLSSSFAKACSISHIRPERCFYDTTRTLLGRRQPLRQQPRTAFTTSSLHHARVTRGPARTQNRGPRQREEVDRMRMGDEEAFIPDENDEEALFFRTERDIERSEDGKKQKLDPEAEAEAEKDKEKLQEKFVLRTLRIIPDSPSYFTARPTFTDDYVYITDLCRRHLHLPTVAAGGQQENLWREFAPYKKGLSENFTKTRYLQMVECLKRMNMIHPDVMPFEVGEIITEWSIGVNATQDRYLPDTIDEFGRSIAIGKRKSSAAKAWVVEGEGDVMVNGKPLNQAFARTHDRASVIWPLKVTNRIDKYNLFVICRGGGTTGQAEASALAVAKALAGHEPALKTVLRKAGCISRDPRRVERKKPGKLKSRKMPAWVKR